MGRDTERRLGKVSSAELLALASTSPLSMGKTHAFEELIQGPGCMGTSGVHPAFLEPRSDLNVKEKLLVHAPLGCERITGLALCAVS